MSAIEYVAELRLLVNSKGKTGSKLAASLQQGVTANSRDQQQTAIVTVINPNPGLSKRRMLNDDSTDLRSPLIYNCYQFFQQFHSFLKRVTSSWIGLIANNLTNSDPTFSTVA